MADVATSADANVKNYFGYSSSDYPGEGTLGVTTYGSGDGRYNWLVQAPSDAPAEIATTIVLY